MGAFVADVWAVSGSYIAANRSVELGEGHLAFILDWYFDSTITKSMMIVRIGTDEYQSSILTECSDMTDTYLNFANSPFGAKLAEPGPAQATAGTIQTGPTGLSKAPSWLVAVVSPSCWRPWQRSSSPSAHKRWPIQLPSGRPWPTGGLDDGRWDADGKPGAKVKAWCSTPPV